MRAAMPLRLLFPKLGALFRSPNCAKSTMVVPRVKCAIFQGRLNPRYLCTFNESQFTLEDPDLDHSTFNVQDILYPDSEDPVVVKLKRCRNDSEVLNIFEDASPVDRPMHVAQTILTLWSLKKIALVSENALRSSRDSGQCHASQSGGKPIVDQLLDALSALRTEISIAELTCSLLYLNKLGVPRNHAVMTDLINECLLKLRDEWDEDGSLTTLSRLTVLLNVTRALPSSYVYPIVMPKIVEKLKNCSFEYMALLTVCLKNTFWYLTKATQNMYLARVTELEQRGRFAGESPQVILKVVNFLNSTNWSNENSSLIKRLLKNVKVESIDTIHDLNLLYKVVQSQLEPADLIKSITEKVSTFREANPSDIQPVLLQCAIFKTLPDTRVDLVKEVARYLKATSSLLNTENLLAIFRVLRQTKLADPQICNLYWDRVKARIETDSDVEDSGKLIHHCHRYMYFNNNLGGTYRYHKFETFLLEAVDRELRHGTSQFIPSKFAQFSAFVIAYSPSRSVPVFIVEKLLAMKEQLTVFDCLDVSKGIQVALELRFRKELPHAFGRQLALLESVLNAPIEDKLKSGVSVNELNAILKSFLHRKTSKKMDLFRRAVEKYKQLETPLNSRIIRDITYNLTMSRYRVPEMCEKLLHYIVENRDTVTGDTVEKILNCCYVLGHLTDNREALVAASDIVQRDFDYMAGLAVVNTSLVLCFYGELQPALTAKVFCIDFIRRLEDEIKMGYSKATYPQRVLNKVMQLNRSVCLDYPELNVPWFQQNYVEAQATKNFPNEKLQKTMSAHLKVILYNPGNVLTNQNTPYGYRIDFLLRLNSLGEVVTEADDSSERLAIMLLTQDSYCENDENDLSGYELLRQRHLEILGYSVLRIHPAALQNVETIRKLLLSRKIKVK